MNDNSIGTVEDIDKLARRQVRPTRVHNEECRRLLKLMGIPVIVVSHDAYRLLVSLEAKVWPASSIGSRRGRSSMRRTGERRKGQSFRSCRYAHRLIRSCSAGLRSRFGGYGYLDFQRSGSTSTSHLLGSKESADFRDQLETGIGRTGDGYGESMFCLSRNLMTSS